MIYLLPATSPVFVELCQWIDSPEMLVQFSGIAFTFPLTVEQLEASLLEPNRYQFGVYQNHSNLLIGYGEIYKHDEFATLGRLYIVPNFRCQGYGSVLTKLLVDYIKVNLLPAIIDLFVFDWNAQAIRCYTKIGFVANPSVTRLREVNGQKWIAFQMIYNEKSVVDVRS